MRRTLQGARRAPETFLAAAIMLIASVPAALAADHTGETRPRIGLVLGGGGARGAAHIGVLRVLEELRVPVDCVAGTSMGAVIGAAYASGMSGDEIERLVGGINWNETFGSAGIRDMQPVYLKSEHITYSNRLEFGVKKKGLLAPGGLLSSQQVDSLLRTIVGRARYQDTFDDLPIPFRAIATDAGSGEMRVLSGGDLSVAIRASMAVPGIFAPVRLENRVLVDGGLVRNLPVDVARSMCADVVIAASLVNPQPSVEQLQSALAVVGQMVDIMIRNNVRAQLQTLTDKDVLIPIELPNMGSGDFDKALSAIPLGAAAARAVAGQLARYSLSAEAYAQWRAAVARKAAAATGNAALVTAIRVDGLVGADAKVVRAQIHSRVGQPIDEAEVVTDAQRIFARGGFEKVDYNVRDTDAGRELQFLPLEKPWGPNFLRFDLGLMASNGGDTGFVLRVDHTRLWVDELGARWYNTLQVGRTALVETSLFQPLDIRQQFFIEPRIRYDREQEDLFRGDQRVARYELTYGEASLDGGAAFGTWGELRLGVRRAQADFLATTGITLLPQFRNVNEGGVTSRFTVDTRDSPFVPTRGTYAHIDLYVASRSFGSAAAYQHVELFVQKALPLRADIVLLEVGGGTDFNASAPPYDLFTLGGIGQLAGFQYQQLRGHEYAFGRIAFLHKLTDLQTLLGQALYAGLSVEAGNMFGRMDDSRARGLIPGSSLFLGGRTPLGVVLISMGYAAGGHKAAFLQLGRPLKER